MRQIPAMSPEKLPLIVAIATILRLLDRDTHPGGAQGTVSLDAQSRPEWNFA